MGTGAVVHALEECAEWGRELQHRCRRLLMSLELVSAVSTPS